MKMNKGIISIFICLTISIQAYSQQDIQKEVRVVKPYTPTLSEASKINLLPQIKDTLRLNPDFGYKIYPKRYETQFKINRIKPAKMVALPLSKLYKSQLTLGVGNYRTPLAEFTFNNLRSKSTSYGLYLSHLSSAGKVKLENGKKVDADYNDNLGRLYLKKMFYRSSLEGNISGGYNRYMFYGYDASIDSFLLRQNILQKIYSAGADIRYYSTNIDSSHLNYDFGLNYSYTGDAYSNRENAMDLNAGMNAPVKDFIFGGDIRVRNFRFSGEPDSTAISDTTSMIVNFNPYFTKRSGDWRFLLGFNTAFEENDIGMFPRGEFEFNIVKDVLIPYMGVGGYREVNNYRKILLENPYIRPGLRVYNSDHTFIVFGGLKGSFSTKMAYNFNATYSKIHNMYFFINDNSDTMRNNFTVAYDNVSLMSLKGEITWNASEKFQMNMKANYHEYNMSFIDKPWHKPSVELALGAGYNLRDKILINTNLFYTGKRLAPGRGTVVTELDPYLDANLSCEYRYTKVLSFFLRFNNFTASKYQNWNQYPVQRFQVIGGFTYAL